MKTVVKKEEFEHAIKNAVARYVSSDKALSRFLTEEWRNIEAKSELTGEFDKKISILVRTLPAYLEKLRLKDIEEEAKYQFISMIIRYIFGETGILDWDKIELPGRRDLVDENNLSEADNEAGKQALNKVAILKLNGGLGTTMGCRGPKSAILVKENKTFLDIIAGQVTNLNNREQVGIPLIIMNSFNTRKQTRDILKNKIAYNEFIQHEFPRIKLPDYSPFTHADPGQEWYPPGHGDLYLSLKTSGMLDNLMEKGIEYLFVSNSDNLGATLEPKILGYMVRNNMEFMMETTPKTKADVKGGTLVRYNGRLELLERAQVSERHAREFEDITRFKIFNTNNIWVRLSALKQMMETTFFHLPIIVNKKTIDSTDIVQLETAMGAAVGLFKRTCSIVVGRDRFLPVKKTSDLFILRSDRMKWTEDNHCLFADEKNAGYPEVRFGRALSTMSGFTKRVKAVPSIKSLEKLDVDGDIYLDENVVFEGRVKITSHQGTPLHLKNEEFRNIELTIDKNGERYYRPY